MKSKRNTQDMPLLADMHTDGIRFDPKVLEALRMKNQLRSAQVIQGSPNV